MTRIHNKEVKNIAECNLIHDIINLPKRSKILNTHYYPILHGCMNTRNVRGEFKNFRIILDSGCISTILMGRLVKKLGLEKYTLVQWNTQAVNITNNLKVKIYFTLPALSATNSVTWNCHVDDSAKGGYNMILGKYLLT